MIKDVVRFISILGILISGAVFYALPSVAFADQLCVPTEPGSYLGQTTVPENATCPPFTRSAGPGSAPSSSQPSSTQQVPCSNGNCNINYQLLEPLPNGPTSVGSNAQFNTYLQDFINLLIGIGALVAVVTLVVGAVMYMTSDVVNVKKRATERMWASIWGSIILIAAVLILKTINPQLITINLSCLGQYSLVPGQTNSSCGSEAPQNTNPGITSQVLPVPGTITLYQNDPNFDTRYAQYADSCPGGNLPIVWNRGTDSNGPYTQYKCQ